MKPIVTEKAVNLLNLQNVLTFVMDKKVTKDKIKEQVEELFGVKVAKVRTLIKDNKKYAYVKLKPDFLAVDVATKLGMM